MDNLEARRENLKIRRKGAQLVSAYWKAETEEEREAIKAKHDALFKEIDDLEIACFGTLNGIPVKREVVKEGQEIWKPGKLFYSVLVRSLLAALVLVGIYFTLSAS